MFNTVLCQSFFHILLEILLLICMNILHSMYNHYQITMVNLNSYTFKCTHDWKWQNITVYALFSLKHLFAKLFNPNTFAGLVGMVRKNYLPKEEGREGGEKKHAQRARQAQGSNPGPAAG